MIKTVISTISIFTLTKNKKWAEKLAKQVRVLTTQTDNLSSVPGIHKLEEENQLS